MTEVMTARHRAAGILSKHKLNMLEAADIAVVDKARLDALEALADAVKAYTVNWGRTRYGSFFRDGESPEGTADRLYAALERLGAGE